MIDRRQFWKSGKSEVLNHNTDLFEPEMTQCDFLTSAFGMQLRERNIHSTNDSGEDMKLSINCCCLTWIIFALFMP